jgi:hypothetical protein
MTTPISGSGKRSVTVRQATADLLRTHGLTTWFGNPGSSELSLLEDFPTDFRYMLGLQEMVPVGMADAYAQITGRPSIVNLHTAPGMGNAQGALYNAYINKTPLIVTAGNQRRDLQNQMCLLTNVDATNVPKPFVKWSAEPAIASEVPAVLARAIHIANTAPRGPVFVSLPMDDMAVELTDKQASDIDVVRTRTVTHAGGFPDNLATDIAARLNNASSPAIIVGGDVETLRRLGRRHRPGRTHRIGRVHRASDWTVWLPRGPSALPRLAAPRCGLDLQGADRPGSGSRHRGAGVPVLPQDRGSLPTGGRQPDPHHQRPRRSRPVRQSATRSSPISAPPKPWLLMSTTPAERH